MSEQNQHIPATDEPVQKPQASEDAKWQRDVIEKLAFSALAEQKTARRWGALFKGLTFAYLFVLLLMALGVFNEGKKNFDAHTALIDISGVIEAGGEVNADAVMSSAMLPVMMNWFI